MPRYGERGKRTVGHVCGAGFDAETTAAICGGNAAQALGSGVRFQGSPET
jgi:hypothetical protein